MPTTFNRRCFTKTSLFAASSFALQTPFSRVVGANEDIHVGVIGFRSMGRGHIRNYNNAKGARVIALCDVDQTILKREADEFHKRNEPIETYTDVRQLLENDSIDAISTATPNHWHALITVWGCQAGKHVCVEKPVSHNIFEGRQMVNAARIYNRLVQADLDRRSDEGLKEAVEYVQQGNLGKILMVRAFDYKRRDSIGYVTEPQPVPDSIDYDLWCGPAPKKPLMRERLHYDWHWVWDTGCGEIGNNGPHQLDICRWVLQEEGLPSKVMSFGGRYGYTDNGETPNTQVAVFLYDSAPIIYESRGLPRGHNDQRMSDFVGVTATGKPIRIEHNSTSPHNKWVIQCEGGYLYDTIAYDNNGKRIKKFEHQNGNPHANFIKALQAGKQSELKTDILEGHISTSLAHLGNISYRVGQSADPEDVKAHVKTNPDYMAVLERFKEHLQKNKIPLDDDSINLGPWLEFDSDSETFIGGHSEKANKLLTRDYREPFVVPVLA